MRSTEQIYCAIALISIALDMLDHQNMIGQLFGFVKFNPRDWVWFIIWSIAAYLILDRVNHKNIIKKP